MKSLDLTKPVTTESLLSEFESRFNQTMDLSRLSKEELEDIMNGENAKALSFMLQFIKQF